MVKVTIRDTETTFSVKAYRESYTSVGIKPNGDIVALGKDDIYYTIGKVDTQDNTICIEGRVWTEGIQFDIE